MLPTFRGKRQNSAWFSVSLFKVAMPKGVLVLDVNLP